MTQQTRPRFRSAIDMIKSINGDPGNQPTVTTPAESMVRVVVQANLDGTHYILAATGAGAYPDDNRFKTGTTSRLWLIAGNLYGGWVPLSQIDYDGATAVNNYLRVIVAEPGGAGSPITIITDATRQFTAVLPATKTVRARVDATNCMWFAFANHDFGIPAHPSNPGEEDRTVSPDHRCIYRPQFYLKPTAASTATITNPGEADRWRHGPFDPGVEGTFRGTASTGGLAETIYSSSALNSADIQDNVNLKKISLIYMWNNKEDIGGGIMKHKVIPVSDLFPSASIPSAAVSIPTSATGLYFAAHDGFEWSNNSGSVYFNVTWS